ncbi:hypothetical protein J4407_02455 [Candidatus Pacearchaeota archaeon]|nr:hypothetical protein [Candidatus Pacearchaeota archaeon]
MNTNRVAVGLTALVLFFPIKGKAEDYLALDGKLYISARENQEKTINKNSYEDLEERLKGILENRLNLKLNSDDRLNIYSDGIGGNMKGLGMENSTWRLNVESGNEIIFRYKLKMN